MFFQWEPYLHYREDFIIGSERSQDINIMKFGVKYISGYSLLLLILYSSLCIS
jgi:hypothetical protein